MRPTLIFFLGLMSIQTSLSQIFEGKPVSTRSNIAQSSFKSFEAYELPMQAIADYANAQGYGSYLTIKLGRKTFKWELVPNNLLDKEVNVTTIVNGEYKPLSFDKSLRTYIGINQNGHRTDRMTITPRMLHIATTFDGLAIEISSLKSLDPSSNPNVVLVYRQDDILAPDLPFCTIKDQKKMLEQHKLEEKNNRSQSILSCREIEIGFATDSRFYVAFNQDVEAILDYNLTILSLTEELFDQFNMDFIVKEIFILTSTNVLNNPWGTTLEVDDLQSDFYDWADIHLHTDVGHLWTTGDLYDYELISGTNYDAVGYASYGGACDDIGLYNYCLLEKHPSINSTFLLNILQTHEYGHLFDAGHTPGTNTIMEPSLSNSQQAIWANESIDEIEDFIVDESCLASCNQCPQFYFIQDYIISGNWNYTSLLETKGNGQVSGNANVTFQSALKVVLKPGFKASSLLPNSQSMFFRAQIAPCN